MRHASAASPHSGIRHRRRADDLLYNLQGVEHARRLIESYVTPENIAQLDDDPIVPRLLRLTRFVYGEMHQIWEDAERFGWQPPET